jgi:multisubunit Na+/H+ antiporter MnhB subunit
MNYIPRQRATAIIIWTALAMALYFVALSAYLPGGAFAAGIMLALAYILHRLTQSPETSVFTPRFLMSVFSTGLALFVTLALLAMGTTGSGSFMGEAFTTWRSGNTVATSAALALIIGAGISLIVDAFVSYTPEEKGQ